MPAPDHCYRAARSGCGCKACIAWRRDLDAHRAALAAERAGTPMLAFDQEQEA